MLKIIQGQNSPIIFTFDTEDVESAVTDLHVGLYAEDGTKLLHWESGGNLEFDGSRVICPISQSESIGLPEGRAVLEIKWTDLSGDVWLTDRQKVKIIERSEDCILDEGGDD